LYSLNFIVDILFIYADLSDEYLSEIRADAEVDRAAGEYNYDQQGADWTGTCRNGQNQSPIDLITAEVSTKNQQNNVTISNILFKGQ